jgi:MFS family permease
MVAVAILAQLVAGFGHPYVATLVIDSIRKELGWSLTLLSALYTEGSALAAALMLFMGRLLDRYGSRVMLTVICLLMGLVTMSMSRITRRASVRSDLRYDRLL